MWRQTARMRIMQRVFTEREKESTVIAMPSRRPQYTAVPTLALGMLVVLGCQNTPVDLSRGPAPLRIRRPDPDCERFEDSLTGGQVFSMYCNQCHNARAIAERPFSNYQNVAAHMRVRANLTGTEHAKLIEFLRRCHDVPSPSQPDEPGPKRLVFGQPMAELHDETSPRADGAREPAQP
jgi:hypothetical protein